MLGRLAQGDGAAKGAPFRIVSHLRKALGDKHRHRLRPPLGDIQQGCVGIDSNGHQSFLRFGNMIPSFCVPVFDLGQGGGGVLGLACWTQTAAAAGTASATGATSGATAGTVAGTASATDAGSGTGSATAMPVGATFVFSAFSDKPAFWSALGACPAPRATQRRTSSAVA